MNNNEDKIIRIPISYTQRKINQFGKGFVPCEVSGRWLQFPEKVTDDRYIPLEVMTEGSGDSPKKICELIVSKEDIMRAINSIEITK